jgi:heme exporter protein CcmD
LGYPIAGDERIAEGQTMNALDIWMRENTLTYIWLGSYAVAFVIFLIEIAMVKHKRKITLQQLRMMRDAENEAGEEN